MPRFRNGVESDDQRSKRSWTNDGSRHGIACKVLNLLGTLSRKGDFGNRNALQNEQVEARRRTAPVGNERDHGRRYTRADAEGMSIDFAIDILTAIPPAPMIVSSVVSSQYQRKEPQYEKITTM